MSNRYVYGVVAADDAVEFETDAVAGADRVYPVAYRSLAALVSDIDTTDPDEDDEEAQRHDEVLREIMEYDGGRTVVPMQYGMAFEDERALKNVLRGARPAFRRALNDVEGAVELGVKVVRDEDADLDEEAIREAFADELESLAEASVEGDRFTDRLLLNASYLVDRENRESFDEAIGRLDEEYDDLTIQYSGPYAPYSFVDVHVGAER